MTLLFAFFVVLFATSRHSAEALGKLSGAIHSGFSGQQAAVQPTLQVVRARLPGASQDMVPLADQLRTLLASSIQNHDVALQETPEGLVISFQEHGFFQSAEANLLPGQAEKIKQAGDLLCRRHLALRVEGHSDDQPIHNAIFASNWELSAARAMTVLLLLVDQSHYDPTRISMAGYGPYRPVADNATAAGRGKNRRVDLVVLREAPQASR